MLLSQLKLWHAANSILWLSIYCSINGCIAVQPIPLSVEAQTRLNNRTAAAVRYSPTPFHAFGGYPAGLLAVLSARAAGGRIIEEDNIQDPARDISASISQILSEKFMITVINPSSSEVEVDDLAYITKLNLNSDFIIDVRTVDWGIVPLMVTAGGYRVVYRVRARLVDTTTQKILAQGYCDSIKQKKAGFGTFEKLTANAAEQLKHELRSEAEFCLRELKQQMFQN